MFCNEIFLLLSTVELSKTVYFIHIHSIITCHIFWENSTKRNKVYFLKMKIRVRAVAKRSLLYRDFFKISCILSFVFKHVFIFKIFKIDNYEIFKPNSETHKINTRNRQDLHRPTANITVYQKRVFYAGLTLHNKLPRTTLSLSINRRQIQFTLKGFLLTQTFYSVDEFINFTLIADC
jgi:hypothetical protein